MRPPNRPSTARRRFRSCSSTVTLAPIPTAILAALVPTIPPPRIVTRPRSTPGIPDRSTPLPPLVRCKYDAPTCTARRPAISLMGRSNGRTPSANVTVSYAIPTTPVDNNASVSPRSAAILPGDLKGVLAMANEQVISALLQRYQVQYPILAQDRAREYVGNVLDELRT